MADGAQGAWPLLPLPGVSTERHCATPILPPGEKHWHGAAPTTAMTHLAIQEQLNGKAVDWMEHVTDEQYRA